MPKLISLVIILLVGFFAFRDPTLYVDENVHYPVTASFCHLAPDIHPNLTNIPAYHALLGFTCRIVFAVIPLDTLGGIRVLSFLFALPVLFFFYLIAKHYKLPQPQWLTLLALFLPISFPFYFLAYTDMMAMATVLAAYYFYLTGRFALAGVVATLSIAVRQNNIIWLIWIALLILFDEFGANFRWNLKSIIGHFVSYLRKTWTFVLGALAFAAFIYWNGGISLAKAEEWAHPSFTLKLGNVYLLLILLAVFYWPLLLDSASRFKRFAKNKWWLLSLAITSVLISLMFVFNFTNNHPYNQHTFSLHNLILVRSTADQLSRLVTLIPLILGLLIVFLTPLRNKTAYLLYPFSLLFILPSWLIEPRYYIVPYTLLLLLKEPSKPHVIKTLLVWQILLSLIIMYGILTKIFFT